MDAQSLVVEIEVELGNDSMQTAAEVANSVMQSLIREACSGAFDPLQHGDGARIRDGNGNTVGGWDVRAR